MFFLKKRSIRGTAEEPLLRWLSDGFVRCRFPADMGLSLNGTGRMGTHCTEIRGGWLVHRHVACPVGREWRCLHCYERVDPASDPEVYDGN